MYLSTTDYVQHKHAPGTPEAQRVLRHDGRLSRASSTRWARHRADRRSRHERQDRRPSQPNVIYLQDLLDDWLGAGKSRVILPITDPYVVHHGALGSFATVYLPAGVAAPRDLARASRPCPASKLVLTRAEACAALRAAGGPRGRPRRRLGPRTVIGQRRGRARSLRSRRAAALPRRRLRAARAADLQSPVADLGDQPPLRNFDAFDLGAQPARLKRDAAPQRAMRERLRIAASTSAGHADRGPEPLYRRSSARCRRRRRRRAPRVLRSPRPSGRR